MKKIFLLILLFLALSTKALASETTVRDFSLYPSSPYVDTGIDLFIGSYLDIRQYGLAAIYIPGMTQPWVGLAGDGGCTADINYTLPGVKCWSLVARIGTGAPFLVGSGIGTYSLQAGRLYLGINHKLPFTGSGIWNIRVIVNWTAPPPPPTPFLKLPWNYTAQGISFSDAALKINSFFDHKYPLLSSGLSEPVDVATTILNFENIEGSKPFYFYSSHDGYDWGRLAGAPLDTPILAAAGGCAIYKSDCPACGNAILIDHENFYQTRYYHLQPTDLVTTSTTQCVDVTQGQQIGKVGFSGNVVPGGEAGAHLHFMLVEDKDRDGDFEDNIPDGVTDPLGWQSSEVDPWAVYSFLYAGVTKLGNDSHYLWTDAIPNLSQDLSTNGGYYTFQALKLNFPSGSVAEKTKLSIIPAALVQIGETLESIGISFVVTVQNLFGTTITQFNQLFTLTIDFADAEVVRFKPETLAIYSSDDGVDWTLEPTTVDLQTHTASAQLNHLTHFALLGELKDQTPPTTTILFNGSEQNLGQFAAPLEVSLEAIDTDGVVDYTLYSLDNLIWQQYLEPVTFTEAGAYSIYYYSVDAEEHSEVLQQSSFTVVTDTTAPEVRVSFDPQSRQPIFTAIDENPTTHTVEILDTDRQEHTFTDTAGNYVAMVIKFPKKDTLSQLVLESLQYNGQTPITLAANLFRIEPTSTSLNLVQQWWWNDELQAKIFYNSQTSQSTIMVKIVESETKETKSGFVPLYINTNSGSVEFGY